MRSSDSVVAVMFFKITQARTLIYACIKCLKKDGGELNDHGTLNFGNPGFVFYSPSAANNKVYI